MSETHTEAMQRAMDSRNRLADHLETTPLNDGVWKLIGEALVDARIEGYLAGLDAVTDFKELAAYSRGYIEGKHDRELS